MNHDTEIPQPKLQSPGQGLPRLELFVARILVGLKLRGISFEKSLKEFVVQRNAILALVRNVNEDLGEKQVLIKRLRGLEDSSRYWSVYMALEHINLVNRAVLDVVSSLVKGDRPNIVISTAAVKPAEGIDNTVVKLYEALCDEFQNSFPDGSDFKLAPTLAHPWFGELTALQWHFFAGFHMKLHRSQIVKILERL